jgi:hypothetical protein
MLSALLASVPELIEFEVIRFLSDDLPTLVSVTFTNRQLRGFLIKSEKDRLLYSYAPLKTVGTQLKWRNTFQSATFCKNVPNAIIATFLTNLC